MSVFKFKQFDVIQTKSAMKVGTDAMVLGAFFQNTNPEKVLDIGTGTGVLSLMFAQNNPLSNITAIEIDREAFEEAKFNFEQSKFSKQIVAVNGDLMDLDNEMLYDFIFSNPPYFENSLLSKDEQKNTARHTKSLNLEDLLSKIASLLHEDGSCLLILPSDKLQKISQLLQTNSLHLKSLIHIFGKPQSLTRHIYHITKKASIQSERHFTIRDDAGNYTDEYKKLTEAYHFKKL